MDSIKKLADIFAEFPTVGRRTASRFVYYLLRVPKPKIDELIRALSQLKEKIKLCSFCLSPFESEGNLCDICRNPLRNKQILCVVEKEADLFSIEHTKKYHGLYVILGGVSSTRKNDVRDAGLAALRGRIETPEKFGIGTSFSEIIIAINPTPEGRITSRMIEKILRETKESSAFKITHLGQGLPVGGELEYADDETLESAIEGRR